MVLAELLAELLRRDVVEVRIQRVEVAELADELRRGLVSDARHAGDVVGRIALERLEVDHLARHEAVALLDPGRVVHHGRVDAHPGRHEPRPVGHELEHVQVAGHDRGLEVAAFGLARERADHVVRLEARHLVDRESQRRDHLADLRELGAQVVRHRAPGRLVIGGQAVPEGRGRQVEGDRDVVGANVLEATQDDVREPEDRVHQLALRGRERHVDEREVAAIDEPVAVEQHQAFHGRRHPPVGAARGMRLRRRGAPRSSVLVRAATDRRRMPRRGRRDATTPRCVPRARRDTHTIRMPGTHRAHIARASSCPSTGRINHRST